jgi:P-type Ca2+ transporter type 2C
MQALAQMSAPRAEVVRGGETREIAEPRPGAGRRRGAHLRRARAGRPAPHARARPGGRRVRADRRVGAGAQDPPTRSARTLVPGDQTNMAFAGTVVTRGRGRGVVVRTGAATELGRIATAVRESGSRARRCRKRWSRFGRLDRRRHRLRSPLLVVVLGLARGMPPAEIFLAAVATAVAAIPEGLPVVLTVTLAIGVRRMARRGRSSARCRRWRRWAAPPSSAPTRRAR